MAISKYVPTTISYDPSTFANFLSTNKVGTFLENCTIESYSKTDDRKALGVSKNNVKIEIFCLKSGTGGQRVYFGYYTSASSSTAAVVFKSMANTGNFVGYEGIVLCNNGFLIQLGGIPASRDSTTHFWIGVTVDKNGDLSVIIPNSDNPVAGYTDGYSVFVNSTNGASSVNLTTRYNSILTSIAPIVPAGADNTNTLPYAYAALNSQLSGIGIAAVTINGSNYISNGFLYIKDE